MSAIIDDVLCHVLSLPKKKPEVDKESSIFSVFTLLCTSPGKVKLLIQFCRHSQWPALDELMN